MAEYQRQVNTPITFSATTNATVYQWKLDNVVVATSKTFQRIFTVLGFHTIEFIGTNVCGDQCIQTARLQIIPTITQNQRQANTLVNFRAITNATSYQWKINNSVVSTALEFQRTFTTIGHYSIEFNGSNTCGDTCTQVYDLEIVSYAVETTPIVIGTSQIIMGDYTTEIKIETPIYRTRAGTTERLAETTEAVLLRIEAIEKLTSEMMAQRANYNTHYYIDTLSTTRRKIDIQKDIGVNANELFVLNEGGGFTLEINDEGYAITPRVGFFITDEVIQRIYVTGSGTAGTGRIRIGAWR